MLKTFIVFSLRNSIVFFFLAIPASDNRRACAFDRYAKLFSPLAVIIYAHITMYYTKYKFDEMINTDTEV